MDEIEKLLKKSKRKDRERLLIAMQALISGQTEKLSIKRLSGSVFYRARVGDFRIIFTVDNNQKVTIHTVRLRTKKTYRSS